MTDKLTVHFFLDTWANEQCRLHWTRMNVESYDDALETLTSLRKTQEVPHDDNIWYRIRGFSIYRNGDFEAKFVWNAKAGMFEFLA